MTVHRFKRLVVVIALAAISLVLGAAIWLLGAAVFTAESGADSSQIFTDPALAIEAEQPTRWTWSAHQDERLLGERVRRELASLWHDAMAIRTNGGELDPHAQTRFEPELLAGFKLAAADSTIGYDRMDLSIVGHHIDVVYVSPDTHFIELVATMTTRPRHDSASKVTEPTVITEKFRTTIVLRTSGWMMTSLQRLGLTNS